MKKYIIGTDACPVTSDEPEYFWLFSKTSVGYGPPYVVEVFGGNYGGVYLDDTLLFDWSGTSSNFNIGEFKGSICIGPIEIPNPDDY